MSLRDIVNVITIQNIAIYLIIINTVAFLAMGLDKLKAKKGFWRIKEGTLLMLAIVGGSIGAIAGMKIFHHKTKKAKFYIGFPTILIAQVVLIVYFWFK